MQRRRCARGLYPRGDSLRPYISCQHTPMAEEIRVVSAAAHQKKIVPQKKTPVWASFLISAAPAEAGGSPLCRTPAGGGESVHIFRGRKRVLVLGKVRADGALTQRVSAAGCCTVQSAAAPCVRGCRWGLWCLRCARRSAMAVSPACPAFVRAVTLSAGVG